MTTTVEGQSVWTTTEPTLEQILSGDYTLPVNFKVVDAETSTYKTISFVFDSVNGARRLELGGGSLDQDNIFKVMNITLEDLGLAQDSTEEQIKQALANHIEGLQIEQKELYLFQIDGFTDGGSVTGNYIPLSGTEEGKPVTGPIVLKNENSNISTVISNFNNGIKIETGEDWNIDGYFDGETKLRLIFDESKNSITKKTTNGWSGFKIDNDGSIGFIQEGYTEKGIYAPREMISEFANKPYTFAQKGSIYENSALDTNNVVKTSSFIGRNITSGILGIDYDSYGDVIHRITLRDEYLYGFLEQGYFDINYFLLSNFGGKTIKEVLNTYGRFNNSDGSKSISIDSNHSQSIITEFNNSNKRVIFSNCPLITNNVNKKGFMVLEFTIN